MNAIKLTRIDDTRVVIFTHAIVSISHHNDKIIVECIGDTIEGITRRYPATPENEAAITRLLQEVE